MSVHVTRKYEMAFRKKCGDVGEMIEDQDVGREGI
jgi:hypothetical protein